MDQRSDEELIKDVQGGSISAFEILVRRYEKKLTGFGYRILNNEKDAEEIAQDAFFKVYRTIEKIDVKRKFSTYLFEIAKNDCISLIRRRHSNLSLADETAIETDEMIYEAITRKERKEKVKQAIATLKIKYRRVVELYYFDNLSYEEIAGKLKLPINTIRTHLLRAKKYLKKYLYEEN